MNRSVSGRAARVRACLIVAAGVGLLGLAGCSRKMGTSEASASSETPLVTVRARSIEACVFQDAVVANGTWRASAEVAIAATCAGVLDSLGVQAGDRVAAGQTFGWIETRESRATLRGADLMLQAAQGESSRAEASRALALARRERVRVPLIAPRSGRIIHVDTGAGAEVAESESILAILPDGAAVFEARIEPSDAGRIRQGQEAWIVAQESSKRSARVSRILPTAGEGDQMILAWLAADSARTSPRIGEFGTATIVVGAPDRAVAVPDSSIVEDDLTGRTSVAVVETFAAPAGSAGVASGGRAEETTSTAESGAAKAGEATPGARPEGRSESAAPEPGVERAIWTPVTLGRAAGSWRKLLSPALAPGTLVIVEGQRGLPDSTRVQIAP